MLMLENDVDRIVFDLEGLTVDSVLMNEETLVFDYADPLLVVFLPENLNAGDIAEVEVYYHGSPVTDTSGWGGVYWSVDMCYNLGVGFEADPHSFGRAWHPCYDNFVERSNYSIDILTNEGRTAYAGGAEVSVTEVGTDSLLTSWVLEEEIPAYLASFSVGDLVHDESLYTSIQNEEIPVWLASRQEQQSNFLSSFQNLHTCIEGYEEDFGPYRWNRVGFVLVPFSGGAMEHATNIAYPAFAAGGNLGFQSLMAHELSHHWWGDLVTCSSQEDMWINEGMASYCEALFFEHLEGEDSYLEYVLENHKEVLLYAHINDGERLPVAGEAVGHPYTYGDHVYNKGADVAHTLRSYMGEDYFPLMTAFLEDHAFQAVSSQDLIDYLDPLTDANIADFFEGWIFSPGFPNFRVNQWSSSATENGYTTEVIVGQYQHYNAGGLVDVPLEITLLEGVPGVGNSTIEEVLLSGESSSYSFETDWPVNQVIVNRGEKLNQAVLAEEDVIDDGIASFDFAEFRIDIDAIEGQEEVWFRAENHWTAADDAYEDPAIHLSTDRFWRLYTEDVPITAECRVRFYGDDGSNNYFDPQFFETLFAEGYTEEDLVMVYRPFPNMPWVNVPGTEVNVLGNEDNGAGYIDFTFLGSGDYAWAYLTAPISVEEPAFESLKIYPNPATEKLFLPNPENKLYTIFDSQGKAVRTGNENGWISIQDLAKGNYLFELNGSNAVSFSKQ